MEKGRSIWFKKINLNLTFVHKLEHAVEHITESDNFHMFINTQTGKSAADLRKWSLLLPFTETLWIQVKEGDVFYMMSHREAEKVCHQSRQFLFDL